MYFKKGGNRVTLYFIMQYHSFFVMKKYNTVHQFLSFIPFYLMIVQRTFDSIFVCLDFASTNTVTCIKKINFV